MRELRTCCLTKAQLVHIWKGQSKGGWQDGGQNIADVGIVRVHAVRSLVIVCIILRYGNQDGMALSGW